jgi:hypothetical protein
MREVFNSETGESMIVPDGTADSIRTEKWLIKQGWKVREPKATPNEVIQFQESRAGEVKKVAEVAPCDTTCDPPYAPDCCKQQPPEPPVIPPAPVSRQDLSSLNVKTITRHIQEFTQEELKVLATDPRKSVSQLALKWIR